MIDTDTLYRISQEVSTDDPDRVCAALDVDPAAVRAAVEGLAHPLGDREAMLGAIVIALLVGIRAGREAA